MKHVRRLIGAGVLALATACEPPMRVETVASPDASLSGLRTFRILPTPKPRDQRPLAAQDPMLVNSITNRALRNAVAQAFEGRGYLAVDRNADFLVAPYASAKHALDVTYWDYGYPWRPRWWHGWGRGWGYGETVVTEYTEGTVIIDVLDPKSKELLWRGRGVALVADDVQQYVTDLKETVFAILERFPRAQPVVAQRQGPTVTTR